MKTRKVTETFCSLSLNCYFNFLFFEENQQKIVPESFFALQQKTSWSGKDQANPKKDFSFVLRSTARKKCVTDTLLTKIDATLSN